MRRILLVSCVVILTDFVFGQKPTVYKTPFGRLYTQAQMDSLVSEMNKKSAGEKVQLVVRDRKETADSIFLLSSLERMDQEKLQVDSSVLANEQKANALIGRPLPPFDFKDIEGRSVRSEDLKGRPVVINLWFTTCPPCILEMPELNRIQKVYRDSGVVFLSMTRDSKEKVLQFLVKREFNFQAIADVEAYVEQITSLFPATVFVDRRGKIIRIVGPMAIVNTEEFIDLENVKMDSTEFLADLVEIYR